MYNHRLNSIWVNRLRERCKGKKVIIVGNSNSLMNDEYGEFIDSHDVVVRFGKGHPIPEVEKNVGKKFDVWISGSLRVSEYKRFQVQPEFKIFNLQQIALYNNQQSLMIPKDMFIDDDFQIYKDFFLMGNMKTHRQMVSWGYKTTNLNNRRRMANGVMSTIWFMSRIRSFAECHVIGFDFMKSPVSYECKGDTITSASWHLPYGTFGNKDWDPHDSNADEAAMMRLVEKGLIFHPMKTVDINSEKFKEISKIHRSDGSNFRKGPDRKSLRVN